MWTSPERAIVLGMETKPHIQTRRRRRIGVAALVVVASLTAGVATATAAHQRSQTHLVTSTSPAAPVAGEAFSITFSLVKAGVALPITGPDCLGMTNGRPIPLASKTSNGFTATCTWNLPSKTGPTFDGMLVVFNGNGTEFFYGYDYPIS